MKFCETLNVDYAYLVIRLQQMLYDLTSDPGDVVTGEVVERDPALIAFEKEMELAPELPTDDEDGGIAKGEMDITNGEDGMTTDERRNVNIESGISKEEIVAKTTEKEFLCKGAYIVQTKNAEIGVDDSDSLNNVNNENKDKNNITKSKKRKPMKTKKSKLVNDEVKVDIVKVDEVKIKELLKETTESLHAARTSPIKHIDCEDAFKFIQASDHKKMKIEELG